jgi:hypothetical protein
MARIRYLLPPFDKPFGGVATIHRHVAWLAAEGLDAAIALPAPPPRDFYEPGARVELDFAPLPGDRLVVPEGALTLLASFADAPVRRLMFCQNQYYLPFGADPRRGIAEFGVERIFGSSVAVRDFFRDVYALDVPIVPYSIDRAAYGPAPKARAILLMPRKRGDLAAFLHHTFKRRHARLADVPWVAVDGASVAEAAVEMGRAQWFLSLSHRESFGLPPLEAMACGAIPVGYKGDGGREYMTEANGFWAEEEDWLACVDALARAIDMVDADPQAHDAMLAAGARTVARYSPAAARTALLEFWRDELAR